MCTNEYEQELDPEQEDQEPEHPGWLPLGKVLCTKDPFFDKFLFMLGYDMSSNIYLVIDDYLSIIDPGNDYTAYLDLFRCGFKPNQIKKIIITHGHTDHCMGIFELLRSYPSISREGSLELILHEASPKELKEFVKKFGCKVTELRGGEVIELSGTSWEVIHTPGHTVDGICLYHAPTRSVLTGDTVQPHVMAEPDKDAGGRFDYYLLSVKELLKREISTVLPGHGAPKSDIGRRVVEETYESLMMKVIGAESPIPWMQGAVALAQKGLLEEAVFCCNKSLSSDAEDTSSLQLKALCLNDLGHFQEALDALETLGKISPRSTSDPFIHMGRGYALMGLGEYEESIKHFEEALRIKPGMKDASMYKGMALYLSGDREKAMKIESFRNGFAERFSPIPVSPGT